MKNVAFTLDCFNSSRMSAVNGSEGPSSIVSAIVFGLNPLREMTYDFG